MTRHKEDSTSLNLKYRIVKKEAAIDYQLVLTKNVFQDLIQRLATIRWSSTGKSI